MVGVAASDVSSAKKLNEGWGNNAVAAWQLGALISEARAAAIYFWLNRATHALNPSAPMTACRPLV